MISKNTRWFTLEARMPRCSSLPFLPSLSMTSPRPFVRLMSRTSTPKSSCISVEFVRHRRWYEPRLRRDPFSRQRISSFLRITIICHRRWEAFQDNCPFRIQISSRMTRSITPLLSVFHVEWQQRDVCRWLTTSTLSVQHLSIIQWIFLMRIHWKRPRSERWQTNDKYRVNKRKQSDRKWRQRKQWRLQQVAQVGLAVKFGRSHDLSSRSRNIRQYACSNAFLFTHKTETSTDQRCSLFVSPASFKYRTVDQNIRPQRTIRTWMSNDRWSDWNRSSVSSDFVSDQIR